MFDTLVVVAVILILESCITNRTIEEIIFMSDFMFEQTQFRFELGPTYKTCLISFRSVRNHVTFLELKITSLAFRQSTENILNLTKPSLVAYDFPQKSHWNVLLRKSELK